MSLMKALLEKPPALTNASKYTVLNGVIYLSSELCSLFGRALPRPFSWTLLLLDMRKGSCA
jgi:hypothetical protein